MLVRAFRVAIRRGHFFRHKAANGHGVPGDVGNIAAFSGHKGTAEIIINASNFDNSSGEALGGIVCIYFSDASFTSNLRGIRKGDSYGIAAVAGQNNILRSGIVNLISSRRRGCFRYGIGSCVKARQGIGSARLCHNFLYISAIL